MENSNQVEMVTIHLGHYEELIGAKARLTMLETAVKQCSGYSSELDKVKELFGLTEKEKKDE